MIKKRKKIESSKKNGAPTVPKESPPTVNLINDSNTLKPPTNPISSMNGHQLSTSNQNGPVLVDAQINSNATENQLSVIPDKKVNMLKYLP